jgi:hypothetical protein
MPPTRRAADGLEGKRSGICKFGELHKVEVLALVRRRAVGDSGWITVGFMQFGASAQQMAFKGEDARLQWRALFVVVKVDGIGF